MEPPDRREYTLSGSGKSAAELGVAAMRVAAEAGVTYSLTGDAPLRGVASSNVDTWARLADVLDDIADQGFRWPPGRCRRIAASATSGRTARKVRASFGSLWTPARGHPVAAVPAQRAQSPGARTQSPCSSPDATIHRWPATAETPGTNGHSRGQSSSAIRTRTFAWSQGRRSMPGRSVRATLATIILRSEDDPAVRGASAGAGGGVGRAAGRNLETIHGILSRQVHLSRLRRPHGGRPMG